MRKNKFPLAKILILATILLLPGFLYYLLDSKGKNRYMRLPIFGPKEVLSTFTTKRGNKIPDTLYHTIKFPRLFNSSHDSIQLSTYGTQLIILNFFYTRNTEVVPLINVALKNLRAQFKGNKRIRFVSIGLDPVYDRGEKLKDYEKSLGVIPGKWDVLTADTSVTYPLAREQFFVNAFQSNDGSFIFSDKIILMDADSRIRGYYTGTSTDESRRLTDEIKVLITEELRKIKAEFRN